MGKKILLSILGQCGIISLLTFSVFFVPHVEYEAIGSMFAILVGVSICFFPTFNFWLLTILWDKDNAEDNS